MDNSLTTNYLFDPITEFVGILSQNEESVSILRPLSLKGQIWPVSVFAAKNRDSVFFSFKDSNGWEHEFTTLKKKAIALDLWLMLFDSQIRHETKVKINEELNSIFTDDAVFDHVQNIVYSAPISKRALHAFFDGFKIGSRTHRFAVDFRSSQDRIQQLHLLWQSMKDDPLIGKAGSFFDLTANVIAAGFFRIVATQCVTQVDVSKIKGDLAFRLKDTCDPRLINKMLSEFKNSLPEGNDGGDFHGSSLDEHDDEEADDEGHGNQSANKTRPKAASSREHLLHAKNSVEKIAALFAKGRDEAARHELEELIAKQTKTGPKHLVKSLCNIATRTSQSSRREISLYLLQRALSQPQGLDAKLYLQIGNEFRSIREFDKAFECYAKAQKLGDAEMRDHVRDDRLRAHVAKGSFAIALDGYLAVNDPRPDPAFLSSFGALYRKMGDLRNAREKYRASISVSERDVFNDVAHAGLAEVAKQSGDPHLAIARYQAIFLRAGSNLEPSSLRVYKLALSQLFRLTGQFEKSENILNELLVTNCFDYEACFQLYKVHLLAGNESEAIKFAKRAKIPDLSASAADLYRLAMARFEHAEFEKLKDAGNLQDISYKEYMPDEIGFVSCKFAISQLANNKPTKAIEFLDNLIFTDKLHKDFSTVLRFHANKKISSKYDMHEDPAICRILKRGFKPIRDLAKTVHKGDFKAALKEESKVCVQLS